MTIRITGNTFSRKEEFKDFGGAWNGDLKAWEFRDGTNVDRWRGIPGLVITGPEPKPAPEREPRKERKPRPEREDDDEWLKRFQQFRHDQDHPPHGTQAPAVHGNDITYLNAFTPKNPPMFAGFASFPDLIEFVEAIPASISEQRSQNRNTGWTEGRAEWAGTSSMPAAIDLARNGWRKGTGLALEAGEIITGDHATQRVRHYAVAGGRVNVGRMLAGNPLHMVSRPHREGRKVITLFVQTWMSAAISAENAIIRAASVAAIADVLQSHGYSCEIVAVGTSTAGSGGRGLGAQVATVVKAAGEPMNIENVVFALGHPSMLRRFMFAVCAVEPRLERFWSGMGGQIDAFDPDDLAPGQYYIPKLLMGDQNRVKGATFKDRVRSLFPIIVPEKLSAIIGLQ